MRVPASLDFKGCLSFMTYKEQLAHPLWQKKRLEIFERDNFTCCICSDTDTQLQVHHKTYITGKKAWEYDNDNLQTLCKDCHLVAEDIKKDEEIPTVAIKRYRPKTKNIVVLTIVKDVFDETTLTVYSIDKDQKLTFIISFSDDTVYGMKDLLESSKKLVC